MWIQEERNSIFFLKSLLTEGKPEWKLKTGKRLPFQVSVLKIMRMCAGLNPDTRFSSVSSDPSEMIF